jgi:methane monooxygenase PmoA-like
MKYSAYLPKADFGSSKFRLPALAILGAMALPCCSLLISEYQIPSPIVSHSKVARSPAVAFSALRTSFQRSNPGFHLQRLESVFRLPASLQTRLVVLLDQSSSLSIHGRGLNRAFTNTVAKRGDLVHLRPGQGLLAEQPIDCLLLTLPSGLALQAPNFLAQGKLATPDKAPCRALGQVWIGDSEQDQPLAQAAIDRLYYVIEALPGAALFSSAQNPDILTGQVDLDDLARKGLLQKLEVTSGSLVYLPRGSHSRLVGGLSTTMLTTPGLDQTVFAAVDSEVGPLDPSPSVPKPSALAMAAGSSARPPFVSVIPTPDGARIEVDGQPFTEFQHGDGRTPGFGQIMGPGNVLMAQGSNFGSHRIAFDPSSMVGPDFESGQAVVGASTLNRFYSRTGQAGFSTRQSWHTPKGRVFLTDERNYKFHARGEERWLDLEVRLRATDRPVAFKDSDQAGLSLKLENALSLGSENSAATLLDSEGNRNLSTYGQRAAWLNASGTMDGNPVGLAILEHPANFRFPTYWTSQIDGTLAAHPFARDLSSNRPEGYGDFVLAAGKEIHLRYRIFLYRGEMKFARIQQLALEMVD